MTDDKFFYEDIIERKHLFSLLRKEYNKMNNDSIFYKKIDILVTRLEKYSPNTTEQRAVFYFYLGKLSGIIHGIITGKLESNHAVNVLNDIVKKYGVRND